MLSFETLKAQSELEQAMRVLRAVRKHATDCKRRKDYINWSLAMRLCKLYKGDARRAAAKLHYHLFASGLTRTAPTHYFYA